MLNKSTPLGRFKDPAEKTDEAQIRELVHDWAKAVRGQDMDGVLAHHADDIVMYDVPPPFKSDGLDEYRRAWDLFFKHNEGGKGSFDIVELNICADVAAAFCYGVVSVYGARVRLTMGFRKTEWRWVIAHEHHSRPVGID